MNPNAVGALPAILGCLANAVVWGFINHNIGMAILSLVFAAFSMWLARR